MAGNNGKRGFTLIELVLVVTVIVLLAVLLIPVISDRLAQAKKTACIENARTLGLALTSEYTLHRKEYMTDIDMIEAVVARQERAEQVSGTNAFEGLCPGGGTYNIVETQPGRFAIVCSKHGDMQTLTIKYSELLAGSSVLNTFELDRLDSTAPDGEDGTYKSALADEMLNYYGVDLSEKTWCMTRAKKDSGDKNFSVFWTEENITEAEAGDRLNVVRYDISSGEYSSGTMAVEGYTDPAGSTYNRFRYGSFRATQ